MLLVLEEHCPGIPSHTVAAGAASLVSSRHCLHTLESRTNTHWALLPLHPVGQFWPTFQLLNAKIHGCNIFKGLSHLSNSGCLGWQSLSSWIAFKISTTYITLKPCSPYTFSFVTFLWVDFSLAVCFPGLCVLGFESFLRANQPNQWELKQVWSSEGLDVQNRVMWCVLLEVTHYCTPNTSGTNGTNGLDPPPPPKKIQIHSCPWDLVAIWRREYVSRLFKCMVNQVELISTHFAHWLQLPWCGNERGINNPVWCS